jgi:hypothetical protein
MIVGEIKFGDIVDLVSPDDETLNGEIDPVVYPVEEDQQKVKMTIICKNNISKVKRYFSSKKRMRFTG